MEDYFDILGINSREDSYTNLLVSAFNDSEIFRKKFNSFFTKSSKFDFELRSRNSFSTIFDGKKIKDIPDLILFNEQEIILIEVKIFASEGFRQTERYSSDEIVERVKGILELPSATFESFFYLTINKANAKSTKFINVSWRELISVVLENTEFNNERISLLMQDLYSRIQEFDNIEKLNNQGIIDFMSKNRHLVTRNFLFERYFEGLNSKIKEKHDFEITYANANNSDGDQFLLLYSKPEWTKLRLPDNIKEISSDEQLKYSKTRNVHIEVNWTPKRNKLSIFVHYETNPYLKKTQLEELSKEMFKDYYAFKNEFKIELYKNIPNAWEKEGNYLTQIKISYPVNQNTTKTELFEWLLRNIELASNSIENTMKAIDN